VLKDKKSPLEGLHAEGEWALKSKEKKVIKIDNDQKQNELKKRTELPQRLFRGKGKGKDCCHLSEKKKGGKRK